MPWLLLLAALATSPASAATRTWDGRGPSNSWSALDADVLGGSVGRTNWGTPYILPQDGDSLVFAGNRRLASDNDIGGLALNNLSFADGAGAFILGGRALSLSGHITNASAVRQTIDLAVTAAGAAAQTWSGGAAGLRLLGTLTLRNNLTLSDRVEVSNFGSDLSLGGAMLDLRSGSTVSVRNTVIDAGPAAVFPRPFGRLRLAGANTRWTSADTLSVGSVQANLQGTFELSDGARADIGRLVLTGLEMRAAGGATVAVGQGGIQGALGQATLMGSVLSVNGAIDVPAGRFDLMDGSMLTTQTLSAGRLQLNRSQVLVSGSVDVERVVLDGRSLLDVGGSMHLPARGLFPYPGLALADRSHLRIADALGMERGILAVASGSVLSSDAAELSDTRVSLRDGAGWTNRTHLWLHGRETELVMSNGSVLQSAQLWFHDPGVFLSLTDATLEVGELRDGGTPLFWDHSVIRITGQAATHLGRNLPARLPVATGNTLDITHSLVVGSATELTLAGGTLKAGRLLVADAGRIVGSAGGVLDMDGIGALEGVGTVQVAIRGGAASRIDAGRGKAAGEVLQLGDATSTSGFAFGGRLAVGAARVILDDANRAQLGTLTTLDAGGQLVAAHGLELGAGEVLRADGAASVQGALRNNGQVQGTGGLLSLLGDVDGEGSFSGRLRMAAGFSPGAGARSLHFSGGDLAFGDDAVLILQILGSGDAQRDRLTGIRTLSADGTLRLVLGTGFQPQAGQRFDLLDWTVLEGRFDAIDWTGATLGAGLRWDASSLYTDGTLAVLATAPVPEPAAAWLWLAGLGGLAAARRGVSRRS